MTYKGAIAKSPDDPGENHRVRAYGSRPCECYHTFATGICARAALAHAVDEDCAGLARRQPVELEEETGRGR